MILAATIRLPTCDRRFGTVQVPEELDVENPLLLTGSRDRGMEPTSRGYNVRCLWRLSAYAHAFALGGKS